MNDDAKIKLLNDTIMKINDDNRIQFSNYKKSK